MRVCKLGKLLKVAAYKDIETLNRLVFILMQDETQGGYSVRRVATLLTEQHFSISKSQVFRHRTGSCLCYKNNSK